MYHGFVRSPEGSITTFDVPGATNGTEVTGINVAGTITGSWFGPPNSDVGQGYVRAADGIFTTFNVPSAGATAGFSINAAGTVAGAYYAVDSEPGFVRTSDGTITTFGKKGGFSSTVPYSINGAGEIAGILDDGVGFVRTASGTIVGFQAPGATATYAYGINSSGAVTGWYMDANSVYHGFLRTP